MSRTKHSHSIPEPIAQLGQQLERWRSENRPRTRLPKPFWSAAVELARQYGIYRTAHALRLDYMGLKKRLLGSGAPQRKRRQELARPAFLELIGTQAEKAEGWVVEFESSQGGKMRIQAPAAVALDWRALLHAWREVQG